MAKKYYKVKDVEKFRFKILEIIDEHKNPILTSEIRKKIEKEFDKDFQISHLRKDYLKRLEERSFIFRFNIKDKEDLKILKKKLNKRESHKFEGQPSYYISIKYIGEFKEILGKFLNKFKNFLGDPNSIEKEINEICNLLLNFELKNDPSKFKPAKIHYHLKNNSSKIKWKTAKKSIGIKMLSYKELGNSEEKLKEEIRKILNKRKRTKKEDKYLKKTMEMFRNLTGKKDKNAFYTWLYQEKRDIEDKELIILFNKILDKISIWDNSTESDGIYFASLSGEITRKIVNLRNCLDKEINLINILNKISKELNH